MARSTPRRARRRTYRDLRAYLAGSGDTQAEMARRIGISQAHISRILNGDAVPRPALATRIARYARIPIESFARLYVAKHEE